MKINPKITNPLGKLYNTIPVGHYQKYIHGADDIVQLMLTEFEIQGKFEE